MSGFNLNSPYKGLVPYEQSEEDARFFFGRETERDIIIANLMGSRLTVLYGASGVGKSSMLNVGVAHHLSQLARRNVAERGRPELAVAVFREWRDAPLIGLKARIQRSVSAALGQKLEAPPESFTLADTLEASAERLGGDLIVILDQFEDYFMYHGQEEGAGTFAAEFPRAVAQAGSRISFLISIREDSLAKLDRFKGRIPNLLDNYLRIEHLGRDAARAAIVKPIDEFNRIPAGTEKRFAIEPALVEAVLDQVRAGEVTLDETGRGVMPPKGETARIEAPYLQLVMTRLWQEEVAAGSRSLRLSTFDRLGGARRIVSMHMDEAMSGMPLEQQGIAAGAFRYLVTPSGAKIAHSADTLAEWSQVPEDQMKTVLEKLSGGGVRLLRPVVPPPGQLQTTRYEVFHDVLASAAVAWGRRYAQAQAEEKARREEQARSAGRLRKLSVALAAGLVVAVVALVFGGVALQARAVALEGQRVANSNLKQRNAQLAQTMLVIGEAPGRVVASFLRPGGADTEEGPQKYRDFRDPTGEGLSYLFLGTITGELPGGSDPGSYFERATKAFEASGETDRTLLAFALTSLGLEYRRQEKYADAERELQRALAIAEEEVGLENHGAAGIMGSLGVLYVDMKKYEESKALLERALTIDENVMGPESPALIVDLNNVALVYFRQEDFSKAEEALKRALAVADNANLSRPYPELCAVFSKYEELLRQTARNREADEIKNRAKGCPSQ